MVPSYLSTAGYACRCVRGGELGMANLWNVFALRVAADSSATALLFGDRRHSRAELHARALQYASALAVRGISRGDVVALQLPKSPVAYGLLLACLRLGAPYVFIDPKGPPDRSAVIIERVRPKLLFTTEQTANPYGSTARISNDDDVWLGKSAHGLPPERLGAIATDPAYIMFTSGSTGEPKGAVIPQQGVLSLIEWARGALGAGPLERFTNVNPMHS